MEAVLELNSSVESLQFSGVDNSVHSTLYLDT